MAYSRIRFEIQNSATMTLVHSPVQNFDTSSIDAGIFEGDILVIDCPVEPRALRRHRTSVSVRRIHALKARICRR